MKKITIFGQEFAWWVVAWAIIGLLIGLICAVLNHRNHCGHKKRHKKLSCVIKRLSERLDVCCGPSTSDASSTGIAADIIGLSP